jgi:hypothetical protein
MVYIPRDTIERAHRPVTRTMVIGIPKVDGNMDTKRIKPITAAIAAAKASSMPQTIRNSLKSFMSGLLSVWGWIRKGDHSCSGSASCD